MPQPDRLTSELERIADRARGDVGLCALHVESGRRIALNGDVRFPMASTVKVPIAVCLLSLVDEGRIGLSDVIEVAESDRCPFSGVIAPQVSSPGVAVSVHKLLDLMLTVSDNTAADVLLRLIGGPREASAFVGRLDIEGIRVDRTLKAALSDLFGLAPGQGDGSLVDRFQKHLETISPEAQAEHARAYLDDTRDTATPHAMVALLQSVVGDGTLSESSRELLLRLMPRCASDDSGLKNALPPGVSVAHKPGEIRRVSVSDVGVIDLPNDMGRLAIAVYVKSSSGGDFIRVSDSRQVIAHVTRAIFDDFVVA